MALNTTQTMLPRLTMITTDKFDQAAANEMIRQINGALDSAERELHNIYRDLVKGEARHQHKLSGWATSNIDNGVIKFALSGDTNRLYTKLSGTRRYVNLT